jgi:DNA polymerase-1
VLYTDTPARIQSPGTWPFAPAVRAVYTVGRDFIQPAMAQIFSRTTDISVDIETYGLEENSRRIKSVSFGDEISAVVMDPRDPLQNSLIRKTFQHCTSLTLHNSPFDMPSLYLNGLIELADVQKTIDTLIWCRLAAPGMRVPKSLEMACDRYIFTGPGGELARAFKALGLSKKEGFLKFDLDRLIYLQGAASDPLMTHRLKPVVMAAALKRITRDHPFGARGVTGSEAEALLWREQRINRVLLARACRGYKVDFEYLDQYRGENALEMAEAEEALIAAGIRPGVNQDLAKALMSTGAITEDHPRTAPTKTYPNGQIKMDQKAIEQISHPLARKFLFHKEKTHVDKDYIQKTVDLSIDGLVHPVTNMLLADTGRMSMGSPPIHQFSGPARGIILADDEREGMSSVDLSQGEPVTVANAARDFSVLEGYESGRTDLYSGLGIVAGMLPPGTTKADCEADRYGKGLIRSQLKEALLAQLYGQGPKLLTAKLGLDPGPYGPPSDWEIEVRGFDPNKQYPKYAEAFRLRAAVFSAMPKTAEFVKTLKRLSTRHKKMMTISGRVLDIPMIKRENGWAVEAHKGVNYFCQGGQYDLIADAMIRMIDAGLGDAIYFTMHDEIVCATSAAHDIQKIMEQPAERLTFWAGGRVPILRSDRADLGKRWGKP